jgi:hypothetical protein
MKTKKKGDERPQIVASFTPEMLLEKELWKKITCTCANTCNGNQLTGIFKYITYTCRTPPIKCGNGVRITENDTPSTT